MGPDALDAQALERLMRRRFSCRAYLPEPVPENVLRAIVTASPNTASWCNSQPWQVHSKRLVMAS